MTLSLTERLIASAAIADGAGDIVPDLTLIIDDLDKERPRTIRIIRALGRLRFLKARLSRGITAPEALSIVADSERLTEALTIPEAAS